MSAKGIMNQLESINYITSEAIANSVGITVRAVRKKLKRLNGSSGIDVKIVANPQGIGPPVKLYEIRQALALWGRSPDDVEVQKRFIVRKKTPGINPGPKIKISTEIEKALVGRTKDLYLNQSIKTNVQPSCYKACYEYWEINGGLAGFEDIHLLTKYLYQKRIMRDDKMYRGYFHSEKWLRLHEKRYNAPKSNNDMPTNRWDYISLFKDIGLIGEGFGAGEFWVIDGTQYDAWVTMPGSTKPQLISYMLVIDGVTGYPMYIKPITGESIAEVGALLIDCINIYGIPRYGVMLDNSRTFRSNAIKNLIEAFYLPEELEGFYGGWDWHNRIFPGQPHPIKYPLAKIPRHSFKAGIEQSFNRLNQQAALQIPGAYQGSRESRVTKYELGSVPTYQLQHAPEFEEAWNWFLNWVYGDYCKRIVNSESLKSFAKLSGLPATYQNAWEFFGGPDHPPSRIPIENQPRAFYYMTDKDSHHRVAAQMGYVIVTHNNQSFNYHCPELTYLDHGDKVCVIPNPSNNRQAFIYKEIYKINENKIPVLIDVEFIGLAEDHTIRTLEDTRFIYSRKANQKKQEAAINEGLKGLNDPQKGWDKTLADADSQLSIKNSQLKIQEELEPPEPEPTIPESCDDEEDDIDVDDIDIDDLLESMNY